MLIYTVTAGDTVSKLAARYGLESAKIIADNGLDSEGRLAVGQSLILLFPTLTHTVKAGETATQVSELYGIGERKLFRNNMFLQGVQTLPIGSQVVIRYEQTRDHPVILGGYAYDFIPENDLRAVLSYMTYVMPFTYGFSADGSLVAPEDERVLRLAKEYGTRALMHLSTLTPEGYFSNEAAHALFANREATRTLQAALLDNIRQKDYDGLDVDFEYLAAEDREAYVRFIAETTALLNENGYICVVALPPKTSDDQSGLLYEGIDYAGLGRAANYCFLMTYEWGYRFGPPMAVAPLASVRSVADYAVSRIPREKLLLGLANYGYDWTLPFVRGESDAPSLSPQAAVELAVAKGAQIEFDASAASPYFYYTDDVGRAHVVWFEDVRSYSAKAELVREMSFAGCFVWELTRRNPQGFVGLNAFFSIE